MRNHHFLHAIALRSGLFAAGVALSACCFASVAVAANAAAKETAPPRAVADADLDRMAGHLMKMMPIDRIFSKVVAERDEEFRTRLNEKQQTCMRRELGAEALTARRRAEALRFAEAHPDDFASGLKLLDDGAASVIGDIIAVSLDGGSPDTAFDKDSVPPDAMVAFVTFAFSSDYAELRRLTGYGEFQNRGAGKDATLDAMMNALAADLSRTCEIPADFFE